MKLRFAILLFLFTAAYTNVQCQKLDTTVKMGDQGYKVECSNKNPDKNEVSINTLNLKYEGSRPVFNVIGKVKKAFTDDMNDDGKPDLILCVYSGDKNEIGSVVAMSYNADKRFEPIYFPDIYLDAKIRDGYKGYDEYSALTGTLLRKFPVYLPSDAPDKPTGGMRIIQYKPIAENGHLTFKVLRWYDAKP
jgi:hypothetical protein